MDQQGISKLLRESQFQGNGQAFSSLIERLSSGAVTAFVGAGASVPLLPLWSQALKGLANQFHNEGVLSLEDYNYLSNNFQTNPLDAARDLEDSVGRPSFRTKISKLFTAEPGSYTPCHKEIIKLSPRGIITTNYDDCLNSAHAEEFRKPAQIFVSDLQEHIVSWRRLHTSNNKTCAILHLHGVSSRPDSMVITTRDYNKLYFSERQHSFIEEVWKNTSLLVVGFSFSDPFLNIFAQLSVNDLAVESMNFALIGQPEGSVVSLMQRKSFENKYRLVPIFYPINGENHSALAEILKYLSSGIRISLETPASIKNLAISEGEPFSVTSSNRASHVETLRQDFERNLMAVGENILYVEPRLMDGPRRQADDKDNLCAQKITIDEIALSADSYLVYAPPEGGATSLGKRLALEISRAQDAQVAIRSAASLPHYKAKLSKEFTLDAGSSQKRVLILDDFIFDRDHRLLRELISFGAFHRFIILANEPHLALEAIVNPTAFEVGIALKSVYLWHLSREDIRTLTAQYLNTADNSFVTLAVDKIYGDLLGLCIPLTPTNVLMYLRVLGREQDFQPLNRVHIVERYILDVLQTPHDAFSNTFPAKSKIEITSVFTYQMYSEGRSSFTNAYWHSFCSAYKERTLIEFDDRKLLDELISTRILIEAGSVLCFKYRFFYTYFLCRFVSSKNVVLNKFIDEEDYNKVYGAVSVLSSLRADNAYLLTTLCDRLEHILTEFSDKYFPKDFDPFRMARWARTEQEQEKVWEPIEEQLQRGPTSHGEIDRLKSSLLSELATEDQRVTFARFERLEQQLVNATFCLAEALVNSDEVTGDLKLRATRLIIQSFMVFLQVAIIMAPILRKRKYVNWFGLLFINNDVIETSDYSNSELLRFTTGWIGGIGQTLIEAIGASKLGLVFKKLAAEQEVNGFIGYLNTLCLIRAKPEGWSKDLEQIIYKMPKDSFYLLELLYGLLREYRLEVNRLSDMQTLKSIIARVHTKRAAGNAGNKSVKRTLQRMEIDKYFSDNPKKKK